MHVQQMLRQWMSKQSLREEDTMSQDTQSPRPPEAPLIHYTADNYQPRESIGFLLTRVKNALMSALDHDLQGLDLTGAQWAILMRIANGCGRTAADLCRDNSYDTGSMTRMLDRLEEKGFIHRERSTEDRRVVQLALTEQGQALYPQLLQTGADVLNRHLVGFTLDEVELLKSLLRRMLANAA